MKIAVDAMGGDNAPAEIVRGAARAAMEIDATILLVGKEKDIRAELNDYYWDFSSDKIQIVNAAEVIENDDKPVHAVRTKKDSSMVRAVELVRDGKKITEEVQFFGWEMLDSVELCKTLL